MLVKLNNELSNVTFPCNTTETELVKSPATSHRYENTTSINQLFIHVTHSKLEACSKYIRADI